MIQQLKKQKKNIGDLLIRKIEMKKKRQKDITKRLKNHKNRKKAYG
jgi:hypothetical protein